MMTDCERFGPDLERYVDRQGSETWRESVRAHLLDCPRCREQVRALEEEAALLGQALSVPPGSLEIRPVRIPVRRRIRRGVPFRWAAGVAAAAAILLLFLHPWSPSEVMVSLPDRMPVQAGEVRWIPIHLTHAASVSGIEIIVGFDAARVAPGDATLKENAPGLVVASHVQGNRIHIAVASPRGLGEAGTNLINIPFTVRSGVQGEIPLRIERVRAFSDSPSPEPLEVSSRSGALVAG